MKGLILALSLMLIASSLYIEGTYGLRCHHCNETSSLSLCHTLVTCALGDSCFLKEYVTETHALRYVAGCAPKTECSVQGDVHNHQAGWKKTCCTSCHTTGCNKNPCKSIYHCNYYNGATTLHTTRHQTCGINQRCYLEVYEDGGQHKYYGGCASSTQCFVDSHHDPKYSHMTGLPSHSGTKQCGECCSGNFCNNKPCSGTHQSQLPIAQLPVDRWCSNCHDADSAGSCPAIKCRDDERCYLSVHVNNGRLIYNGGCTGSDACMPPSTVTGGTSVCTSCCGTNFCNSHVCDDTVQKFLYTHTDVAVLQTSPTVAGSTAAPLPRCYQCYDLRLDARGLVEPCVNVVSCSSYASKCSTVYRQEGTLLTVDMDCEESLPCNQAADPTQVCGGCCDGDTCNGDLDCRTVSSTFPKSTPVTTPSTTAFSTQRTTPRSYKGVQCAVCTGPLCGVSPGQESIAHCPDNLAPFCLNKITNDADGSKRITKRCGGILECEDKWVKESSNKTECVNFDPSSIYTTDFECTFCCTTSNCNTKIHPDAYTLF